MVQAIGSVPYSSDFFPYIIIFVFQNLEIISDPEVRTYTSGEFQSTSSGLAENVHITPG